jgi:hypothetical protein
MATSKTGKQLAKRLELIADGIGSHVEMYVRKAAIAADTTAVMSTPVDTGRARSNWRVAIGAPILTETGAVFSRKGGSKARTEAFQSALNEGMAVAPTWRLGMGSIFISNSVPYIGRLDKGYSAQAPKGMTLKAIAAARKQLIGARLLRNNDD